jgi:hypothetical protein
MKTNTIKILVLLVLCVFVVSCVPSPESVARARAIESAANQDAADRTSARSIREAAPDYTPVMLMIMVVMFVGIPFVAVVGVIIVKIIASRPATVVERVVYLPAPPVYGNSVEMRRLAHNRVQNPMLVDTTSVSMEVSTCVDEYGYGYSGECQ